MLPINEKQEYEEEERVALVYDDNNDNNNNDNDIPAIHSRGHGLRRQALHLDSNGQVPSQRSTLRHKWMAYSISMVLVLVLVLIFTLSPLFHNVMESSRGPSSTTTESRDSWPALQDTVCPNMKPLDIYATIGPLLLERARTALGLTLEYENGKIESPRWRRFWKGLYYKGLVVKLDFMGGIGQSIHYEPIWKCSHNSIVHWMTSVFAEANRSNYLGINNSELEALDYSKICLVTAIRDPISHFLSGYNEIDYRLENHHDRRMEWVNPTDLHERFEAFVKEFLLGYPMQGQLEHVFSMMRILAHLDAFGVPTDQLSYLPSLKNLSYTWPLFVHETCSRKFPGLVFNSSQIATPVHSSSHATSSDPLGTYAAAKQVWARQGPVAQALCYLHLPDYACWRNLPDGVPPLCLKLYRDAEFQAQIFNITRKANQSHQH